MSYNGKNAGVACFLSLLIVGAGQFYNEQALKGVGLLIVAIIAGVAGHPGWWLAAAVGSAVDAYQVAKSGTSFLES
jgi:TM2 domain-containing membrane protein YozV